MNTDEHGWAGNRIQSALDETEREPRCVSPQALSVYRAGDRGHFYFVRLFQTIGGYLCSSVFIRGELLSRLS
jgi:hypothetical protein